MTNRREFLHLGVAALSLPIAARAGGVSEIFRRDTDAEPMALYKVIFDKRFGACRRFANEMKRRALAMEAIRGDVTSIWYGDLYYQWKGGRAMERAAAIAGMTAPGAIFCLETLARDAGMRVALRVDHRWSGEQIEHEVAGPKNALTRMAELEAARANWPQRIAEMVASFPVEAGSVVSARVFGEAARGADDPEHLVTWVITSSRCESA
jgi:hypothetical protein